MSMNAQQARVAELARQLKLPTLTAYHDITRQLPPSATFGDCLSMVLERELDQRQANRERRLVRAAGFPFLKSLNELDLRCYEGQLSAHMLGELSSCAFAEERRCVLISGGTGRGKTHLAIGLGLRACTHGKKVLFALPAPWSRSCRRPAPPGSWGSCGGSCSAVSSCPSMRWAMYALTAGNRSCSIRWWPSAPSAAAFCSPPIWRSHPGRSALRMRRWWKPCSIGCASMPCAWNCRGRPFGWNAGGGAGETAGSVGPDSAAPRSRPCPPGCGLSPAGCTAVMAVPHPCTSQSPGPTPCLR